MTRDAEETLRQLREWAGETQTDAGYPIELCGNAAIIDRLSAELAASQTQASRSFAAGVLQGREEAAKVADGEAGEMGYEAEQRRQGGDPRADAYAKGEAVAESIAELIRDLPAPSPAREASAEPSNPRWHLQQTWSANVRPDGSLEPGAQISGNGINWEPMSEAAKKMSRVYAEDFGRIKPGDPLFLVDAPFILDQPSLLPGSEKNEAEG